MSNKKVLIVNPYWDSLGGGERYVSSFAKWILDQGWKVDLLWPENFTTQLRARFGLDLAGVNWLRSAYTSKLSHEYDLLFWVSDGSLPVSLARKTVIHMQFPFHNIGGRSPVNLLKSRFYTFVVNSLFTKSFIDNEFAVNSTVVYPPVDTKSFSPGKKEKLILYVGRFSNLTQAKGQLVLIDAFRGIYKKLPGWKLILAGGASVGATSNFMSELRSSSNGLPVTLVTNPSFDQVKSLFARASIFWSASGYGFNPLQDPTKVEHFGISVVEGMSAGAVPIITNLGGFKEIVDHGKDGFLWSEISELQKFTLQAVEPNSFSSLTKMAVNKSKIFDISEFNLNFSRVIGIV
jgi:glycosyltransferase involved in cell wall biosynthesis